MKKLLYIIILTFVLLPLHSCREGAEEIFDKSSAERIAETLEEIKTGILSSEEGWALDYFLPSYGSVPILCKFHEDGTVEMSRVFAANAERPNPIFDSVYVSNYSVKYDSGPIISLSTYNNILHPYADPGKDGKGFEGDYEFIVDQVMEGQITLRGKKHDTRMSLWKLSESTVWPTYLENNMHMLDIVQEEYLDKWRKRVMRYGDKEEVVEFNLIMGFKFPEEVSVQTKDFINIVVTDKSFRLQYPIVLEGKEVYEFVYNEASNEFLALNADAVISDMPLNPNEQFLYNGSWFINRDDISDYLKPDLIRAIKSYNGIVTARLATSIITGGKSALSIGYLVFIFPVPGTFYYDFTPVEGTSDLVKVSYTGRMDGSGSYLINNAHDTEGVRKFFDIVGGAGEKAITYKLTVEEGTQTQPSKMKMVNVDNPQHYIYIYNTLKTFD